MRTSFLLGVTACLLVSCSTELDLPSGPPLHPLSDETDDAPPVVPGLSDVPSRLDVQTYDGSGELVHPDVFVSGHAWRGKRYWFAATPYPKGNPVYENPSLFNGEDGTDWNTPTNVTNPLAMPEGDGNLSDPDIVHDPTTDDVFLYYRESSSDADRVFLRTSHDGTLWANRVLVLEGARNTLISPAIVREMDGSWRLWSVDAGAGGCKAHDGEISLWQRHSRDGLEWGHRLPVALSIPGWIPWHWDVQYVRQKQEYWALIAAFPRNGTCAETSLFYARSGDGTTWQVAPTPLLARNEHPALRDLVYRSTFRYFPATDEVTVWYSGARLEDGAYHYSLAVARYALSDLLRRVNAPASASSSRTPLPVVRSVADSLAVEAFIANAP